MSQPPVHQPQYLGYANTWKHIPPLVRACRDEVANGIYHRISKRMILKYTEEIVCQTCGYRYMVGGSI